MSATSLDLASHGLLSGGISLAIASLGHLVVGDGIETPVVIGSPLVRPRRRPAIIPDDEEIIVILPHPYWPYRY